MTYNTRVLVGLAAILLVAVVFAPPALAGGNATETYASIAGLNDLTIGSITNPSFEAYTIPDGAMIPLASIIGWTQLSGSSKSVVYNPTSDVIYGAGGQNLPTPTFPAGLSTPNCIVGSPGNPGGFVANSDGANVLACYQADMMNQTIHVYDSPGTLYTTAAHQTYVMTWEFGEPAARYNNGSGFTVGCFYGNTSAFCWINNDTSFDSAHTDGGYGTSAGYMYQFSWSFTTDSSSKNYTGKNISLRFGGGTTTGTAQYNLWDNVHLYANVVPEPSTTALLVTSALGMLAYAWRRKRRK